MRPDTRLDYAVFQLNPTRTRCELHIAAQGLTYKLAAGLLQPFIVHLSAAEEQLAGGGYSIHLEPPDPGSAAWFTKGTMERFVRFVSTPEVLERASAVEMELIEIKKVVRLQSGDTSDDTQNAEELLSKLVPSFNKLTGGMPSASENMEKPAKESFEGTEYRMEETTKQRLLAALEARKLMLQKELEVALARAIAAGFNPEHIGDLIIFAETFGAKRLCKACSNFLSLCKMRQQPGLGQDDRKVSTAEALQSEMGIGGNSVHHMGYREFSDFQGRGSKQDDFCRSSLPSDGRPLMGEGGLEKLTRRGSLDELTGEFLQVAARLRSSAMLEGVNADRPNNWQQTSMGVNADRPNNWQQTSMGGGNHQVSEEMQAGIACLGSSGDFRDAESALKLARGQQIMGAWRGQPQNHPIHNVPSLRHGPIHSSLPASFGFPGFPPPSLSYPLYPGNPYMGHAYPDVKGWQIPPPVSSPFWPHPAFNSPSAPNANERGGDGVLSTSQKQEVSYNTSNVNEHAELSPSQKPISNLSNADEPHGECPTSMQRELNDKSDINEPHGEQLISSHKPANDLPIASELNGEPTLPKRSASESSNVNEQPLPYAERPSSDSLNVNEFHGELSASTCISTNPSVCKDTKDTASSQQQLPEIDKNISDSFHHGDDETFTERTRRLPVRSSSPSRRSASPLRKVQIGRSGSRRPAAVAIRSINYIAHSTQEQREREDDRESSESWSEDDDERNGDEPKEQPVRARVQDVIGLFERKKNGDDTKEKLVRKETTRLQSKNSVLKRWTESSAIKKEASETEDFIVSDQLGERVLLAMGNDASGTGSNELNVSDKTEGTNPLQEEITVASNTGSCHGQLPSDEQSAAKDFTNILDSQSEVPDNQKRDDYDCDLAQREENSEPIDFSVTEVSTDLGSISCDTSMGNSKQALISDTVDDVHSGHEKNDEGKALNEGQENGGGEVGMNSEAANSKKVSARDAKAKTMQEMLERRKAASGNRTGKSNPLAEAQLRAEKLRAYKAGLQKSKQEKDEEEKKRIEELKSQRKERIAARSSPVGGSSTQSPATRQAPQTPPLTISKSSPTAISHKLSGTSPRGSISVSTALVSSNVPKPRATPGNKLPRTPTGTPRANENALSRSVPSLSELKKESPKPLAVRSSTGSQRLSQIKKNLRDADPNSSPKANGHSEEKRRSLPLATIRKGIPPAKDTKNESSPTTRKSGKASMAASKHQKKQGNSLANGMPKRPAVEAAEIAPFLEQVDADNMGVAVEVSLEVEREAGTDNQELGTVTTEANADNNCSSQELGATEDDNGSVQIRALVSTETETSGAAQDSFCLVDDDSKREVAISSEPLSTEDVSAEGAPLVAVDSHTDSVACSDREFTEAESEKNAEDNYCAPIAHASLTEAVNSATCEELDVDRSEPNVSTEELPGSPPPEPYNPPHAPPSESPIDAPKNLPRLHEAIQQAHSPEFIPGAGGSRQSGSDEPGPQRTPKDHAKGLKRLLLLGRKSGRSSAQNASDWVSVSMVSEVGEDGDRISSGHARKLAIGSAPSNADTRIRRADKPRVESNPGSSSNKGSRSFFSLSTFRGKGEGKS